MSQEDRSANQWQYHSDRLKQFYVKKDPAKMDYAFGFGLTPQKGVINEIPAPNARLFQSATGLLSKILWCFPLMILVFKPTKKIAAFGHAPLIHYSKMTPREIKSFSITQ